MQNKADLKDRTGAKTKAREKAGMQGKQCRKAKALALAALVGITAASWNVAAMAATSAGQAAQGPGVGLDLPGPNPAGESQASQGAGQGAANQQASPPAQETGAGSLVNGHYMDAFGNPVPGALAKGITVTKYQNRAGQIDWKKVAADGVSFAMVRLGYHNDQDPYFGMNMRGAQEAGIKTGIFFYTQALDVQTAVDEARYVLDVVKDYGVSYPIAYDVESQVILDSSIGKQQLTDQVNAFCKVIQDAGYRPIVYSNNEWLTNHMDTSQIPYDIWYARYGTINQYPNRTIWQCTDKGKVNGIQGNVTIELAFADYASLIPADGWKNINGKYYYMKGYHRQTGWIPDKGKWYYLDSNGAMVHDVTLTIDGKKYAFGSDGAWVQ